MAERLRIPQALTEVAKAELQRQETFECAARLIWGIYFQTTDHKEKRDANCMIAIRGETQKVPVEIDGKEYNMTIADVSDYIHSPNKQYGWHDMGGLSIRVSDPATQSQPAEIARAVRDGRIIKGFVRKTGYETYESLDTQTAILEGISELLENYGRALVDYDPAKARFV